MVTQKRGYLIGALGIFFWLCLWGIGATAVNARSQLTGNSIAVLTEMDLGLTQTLKAWYEDASGETGHDDYFGAYVTLPVTDTLYIGLGTARPAESRGAYFAKFDGDTLTGIFRPDEDGLHELLYDGTVIHIAGTDPGSGDDHSAGNHYIYTPTTGTYTKYRDSETGLPNVFHTWSLWLSDTVLYAAVSSHNGTYTDNCTINSVNVCMGQIFTSTDRGATWTWMSDLGGYRAYDIIGFAGDLYAIANDRYMRALSMSRSTDGGQTWTGIPELQENVRRVHMVEFHEQLIATSFDRAALYALQTDGTVSTHTLPLDYRVGTTYTEWFAEAYTDYKVLTVVGEHLYLIAQPSTEITGSAILRTADLQNWERMAQTDARLISLSYWEDNTWLVASSAGTNAALWYMDLSEPPLSVTARTFKARPSVFPMLLAGMVVSLMGWRARVGDVSFVVQKRC